MKIVLAVIVICSFALVTPSQAKHYSTCVGAYNFYLHDKKPHKAFATTNGTLPDHGDVVCGGSGGNDLGRAIYNALNQCNQQAKKSHFSGACKVIKQQ